MSTMKTTASSYNVLYGPNASIYPVAGTVYAGETVTAKWREGSWIYIEYTVTSTGKRKRGYVYYYHINITENIEDKVSDFLYYERIVKEATDVYFGPSSSTYEYAGWVGTGEPVVVLYSGSSWGYQFIEYTLSGTNGTQRKRAWISAQKLTTEEAL